MIGKYYYGTGRRKSSIARVFIQPGKGNIVVNNKPVDEYFSRYTSQMILKQPLELTNNTASFDIKASEFLLILLSFDDNCSKVLIKSIFFLFF